MQGGLQNVRIYKKFDPGPFQQRMPFFVSNSWMSNEKKNYVPNTFVCIDSTSVSNH